uniref:F-box domain-containing protein n=1 Tax=Salix viminalis TaxID=40686 RepID=A0A6N2MZ77_SALVM
MPAGSCLPEDMIRETLLRLPVQSLLRFQAVCKRWLALITSSNFILTHCKHRPKHSIMLTNTWFGENYGHSMLEADATDSWKEVEGVTVSRSYLGPRISVVGFREEFDFPRGGEYCSGHAHPGNLERPLPKIMTMMPLGFLNDKEIILSDYSTELFYDILQLYDPSTQNSSVVSTCEEFIHFETHNYVVSVDAPGHQAACRCFPDMERIKPSILRGEEKRKRKAGIDAFK